MRSESSKRSLHIGESTMLRIGLYALIHIPSSEPKDKLPNSRDGQKISRESLSAH